MAAKWRSCTKRELQVNSTPMATRVTISTLPQSKSLRKLSMAKLSAIGIGIVEAERFSFRLGRRRELQGSAGGVALAGSRRPVDSRYERAAATKA
ncbi:hypothetical protein D3C87_1961570 [compost metagenome]